MKKALSLVKIQKKSLLIYMISFLSIVVSIIVVLYSVEIHGRESAGLNLSKDPDVFANNIFKLCEDKVEWRECYGEQIALANYQFSLPVTLSILEDIKELDQKTRDCHLLAHRISISEVEKNPSEWIKIFDYVDQTTCNNGFVHGVLEGRSRFDPSLVLNEKTIPEICKQIEEKTLNRAGLSKGIVDDSCAHIMGHILLAQEFGDINKAVQTCSKVQSNYRRSCYDGIFMENITRENLEAHEVAKRFALTKSAALGLEQLCKQYSGESGRSCWRELAHIYTEFTVYEPLAVYDLCYQTENREYAHECYMHSLNLMILSAEFSGQRLQDSCSPYWNSSNGEDKICIERSLSPLLGSSLNYIDRASEFCQYQPETNRKFCYSKIGGLIKARADLEKQLELCQKVPKDFLDDCLLRN